MKEVVKTLLRAVLALSIAWTTSAATRNNDDSCDIAVMPAATLLLPYFEVDLDSLSGETTVFTITNVRNLDTIARVTLWTDHAFPVFTFNIYLTGYDVQTINLYDILSRGVVAPDAGTGTDITRRGSFSERNPSVGLGECARLPGNLDDEVVIRMQAAFLDGFVAGECFESPRSIGDGHAHAIGYATIDVVGNCSHTSPADASYWTNDLRYDNVLIGDSHQIVAERNLVRAGPLVHIRAVPEGDRPRERAGFPRTFYARYQSPSTPDLDGRQPLPSQFATRWLQGGPDVYATSLNVWREGRAGRGAACIEYASEDDLAVREIVVFDEQENAVGSGERIELSTASRTGVDDPEVFPQLANGATSGWMYLNLDRTGRDDVASQAWVISSMQAAGTYSTDIDAIALGNGCTAPAAQSEVTLASVGRPIAPAPNESSARRGVASTNNDDSCDIALLPAATLLLPYFEVQFAPPPPPPPNEPPPPPAPRDPTLFTITNVSPTDQIARVTLWTDYGYPVLTFNIFLTGYDVQSISLEDILRHGLIAPEDGTGTSGTRRGDWSHRNKTIDTSDCGRLPGRLSDADVVRIQRAFLDGEIADAGDASVCNGRVGGEHDNAIGYATIDLVRNCKTNGPFSDEYWTEDLAFDNVLIGDYQQVDSYNGAASGSSLVHIRAIPEGGTIAERRASPAKYDAGFPRTFYSRYQAANAPRLDARQPLPSVFAARWSRTPFLTYGAPSHKPHFKIWREGGPGRTISCREQRGPLAYEEAVLFDDAENAFARRPSGGICCPMPFIPQLPATSRVDLLYSDFPDITNGAPAGWMYLNLDNGVSDDVGSSNWVISSSVSAGRYAIDFDAAALGNGCSAPAAASEITRGSSVSVIGPRPNTNP